VIKVLGWLGMEEGMAIEDKRISKGILRGAEEGGRAELPGAEEPAGVRRSERLPAEPCFLRPCGNRCWRAADIDRVIWKHDQRGDQGTRWEKYITKGLRRQRGQRMGEDELSRCSSSRTTCAACTTWMNWKPYVKEQAKAEALTDDHGDTGRISWARPRGTTR